MRVNQTLTVICCTISLFFAACIKEKSLEPNYNSNNNGSTDGTYQPMSANSYWKYRQSGTFTGESTLTATGKKKTVNGIDYYIFNGSGVGGGEALFGIKDHNYYQLAQGVAPNGASFDINFLYLNDTASVGYTWQHQAGQGNGFTAHTPGTIVEKGITMTVEGKTYKDVIHTRMEIQYDMPVFGSITFATYDYYIAKNIGVIKADSEGDPILTNNAKTASNLFEYSIK
jgi:hypothetical protein